MTDAISTLRNRADDLDGFDTSDYSSEQSSEWKRAELRSADYDNGRADGLREAATLIEDTNE